MTIASRNICLAFDKPATSLKVTDPLRTIVSSMANVRVLEWASALLLTPVPKQIESILGFSTKILFYIYYIK